MVMALGINRQARERAKHPAGKKAEDVMHDLLPCINKCILYELHFAHFQRKLAKKQK
jgi:hypothetical protein